MKIDTKLCMGLREGERFGGARCQKKATHSTYLGRRCSQHADQLREAFRSTNTLINVFGRRGRYTEEEIARMVVELANENATETRMEKNDGKQEDQR